MTRAAFAVWFVVTTAVKVRYLGVNVAGVLSLAHLLGAYGLNRLSVARQIRRDPMTVELDENGYIRWRGKA